jgi:hypothetical protein
MVGTRQTEADLVICMVRDINTLIPGAFCWRMETRGIPKYLGKGRWKVEKNTMERGKPDIAGVVDGKSFVIEAKSKAGRLMLHQKEWLVDYIERGNGRAAVCRTSSEALEFVSRIKTGDVHALGYEFVRLWEPAVPRATGG